MKYQEISDVLLEELLESVEGSSANAMWLFVCEDILTPDAPYKDRKELYLSVMYRLMKEGRLKLGFGLQFLEGSVEEQVQYYAEQWPEDETWLWDVDFQFSQDPATGELIDLWPRCGFVWVYEDGFTEWTSGSDLFLREDD